MFKTLNVEISRQTMANWMVTSAFKLKKLYALLKKELLLCKAIGIDETVLQVIKEPDRSAKDQSFMWHMRGSPVYENVDPEKPPDEKGGFIKNKSVCYFEYRTGRSAGFLEDLLKEYRGAVITDGWESYAALQKKIKFIHAGCWAHARRYFYKVYEKDKQEKTAEEFLRLIGKLFRLEKIYKKTFAKSVLFAEKRLKARRRFSRPVVKRIENLLREKRGAYPPKSGMGSAIEYLQNQWAKLVVFLENGHAPLDNNAVENGIRPFVIGRKNWLFSFTPNGAFASALLYSLVETAKANGMNPYDYLLYLFEKFPFAKTESEMQALLPNRVDPKTVEEFCVAYGQV